MIFHDLKIRVNKYGTDAKEATTLDGSIENSKNFNLEKSSSRSFSDAYLNKDPA